MGARAIRQVLILLLAAASLRAAEPVAPSTTPNGTSSLDETDIGAPIAPTSSEVGARAVEALQALAAAYGQKRRSSFMKRVSDDFTGDLGTLEDALSSDFRAYRTIDLSIIPQTVVAKGLKSQVTFRFDLNVTDDLGKSTKFSGQATYTFVDEASKGKLLTMDRVPIFGTSLSSVDNPIPKSQGTPTAASSNPPASGGCGPTTQGSAVLNAEGASNFDFASGTTGFPGSGDIAFSPGLVTTNAPATIADLGPCSIAGFGQDPADISDTSEAAQVGECYAVRTKSGKFAAFQITSFPPSEMAIQYKFQPSGQRCF